MNCTLTSTFPLRGFSETSLVVNVNVVLFWKPYGDCNCFGINYKLIKWNLNITETYRWSFYLFLYVLHLRQRCISIYLKLKENVSLKKSRMKQLWSVTCFYLFISWYLIKSFENKVWSFIYLSFYYFPFLITECLTYNKFLWQQHCL